MRDSSTRVAVVLLQLGGPDSLRAVEPFLYNLFCDPDIIDLPLAFLFRKPLARFISRRRAPRVQEYYSRIGKKSPLLKLTLRQARALEVELRKRVNADVFVAMRYWNPLTESVIAEVDRRGYEKVILLPLYPQFSKSTTGSSVNEWARKASSSGLATQTPIVIREYPDHPDLIAAFVRNIGFALRRVPAAQRQNVHLLFSAHGTPMKLVREGDPYQGHILRTYQAIVESGGFGLAHHLCYQSKVGPQKWLEPTLSSTIARLADEKVSHVIVVPLAFVSDHSETLWEINMEARHEAHRLGIRHFDITPALNTTPAFVRCLTQLVLESLDT